MRRDDPVLDQLSLGYRDGPLAVELRARPGPVRAGDRAPDAPGQTAQGVPVRLFDLFRGPHATLLAFGADAWLYAQLRDRFGDLLHVHPVSASHALPYPGSVADIAGYAHRAYGIDPAAPAPTVILVRPDGYLGLATDLSRSDEAAFDAVAGYLNRITNRITAVAESSTNGRSAS
jgi:hypothetical protein